MIRYTTENIQYYGTLLMFSLQILNIFHYFDGLSQAASIYTLTIFCMTCVLIKQQQKLGSLSSVLQKEKKNKWTHVYVN